jgi:uncharacterized tellurite resistance protein B-like protein
MTTLKQFLRTARSQFRAQTSRIWRELETERRAQLVAVIALSACLGIAMTRLLVSALGR